MAKFIRKEQGIKLEFGSKVFVINVADSKLNEKLIEFGKNNSKVEEVGKRTIEEQKQELIDFYELTLGDGAYEIIKNEVYDGEELIFEELLDIGYFLVEEVNKYNKAKVLEEENRLKLAKIARK